MTPREREPGREWRRIGNVPDGGSLWNCGPIRVGSSLAMAKLPRSGGIGPQWLISVSNNGYRPKPHHVRKALRAFGMVGAEEDNHHPGVARHFWMPVDPTERIDCECKVDEVQVVEPDGYRWSNSVDECRGCELQRVLGRPCSIHAAT